jgi:hypothetical protein
LLNLVLIFIIFLLLLFCFCLSHWGENIYLASRAIARVIKIIAATIAKVIQIGERTHNQLHLITPVSLSAMKRIVSRPENPIDDEFVLLLI